MQSLKVKLTSALIMVAIAVAMIIVGICASQSQTINMQGSVNFNIADKCLYVKDVRMQVDNNSEPYSLKEQGLFLPGYINGNFNMNLGTFTNTYGSFAIYFDVINTIDEESNETTAYSADATCSQSGVEVKTKINNDDNIIPKGTIYPNQITDSTPASASIILTVTAPNSEEVDLSTITIIINEKLEYLDFLFTQTSENTGSVISYIGSSTEVEIPETYSIYKDPLPSSFVMESASDELVGVEKLGYVSSFHYIDSQGVEGDIDCVLVSKEEFEGLSFPVTIMPTYRFIFPQSIANTTDFENFITEFADNLALENTNATVGPLKITPANSEPITATNPSRDLGNYLLLLYLNIMQGDTSAFPVTIELEEKSLYYYVKGEDYTVTSILDSDIKLEYYNGVFVNSNITSIVLPSSLQSIGKGTFANCTELTNVDLSRCVNLESINEDAFYNCSRLTRLDLSNCTKLSTIEEPAFTNCTNLTEVIIGNSYVYDNANSSTACGGLFNYATTIKVLSSLVSDSHPYINSTNFPNVTSKVIAGKNYTVYSK